MPRASVAMRGALMPRRLDAQDLRFATAGAATAALGGYAIAGGQTRLAVGICLLIPLTLLLVRPVFALVLLGALLPLSQDLVNAGSLEVSAGDLLLVLLLGAILLRASTEGGTLPAVGALGPVAFPVLVYSAAMVALLAAHPGLAELAETLQRFELFLIALVVGAFAALRGQHAILLKTYVLSMSLLAVAWPIDDLGLNKNPSGQLIGNAILLLVGYRPLRRYLPCLVLLVPGLLLTQSRGAILATALGIGVMMAMQHLSLRAVLPRAVPVALIAAAAFLLLPAENQERITTFSGGHESHAAYAITLREGLAKDAQQIIAEHPWTGVGVGNYAAAAGSSYLSPVEDPHQVLLLQAAEGGYLLAACFVLLVMGSALALYRMRRIPVAPAAAAVLLSTAAHGLVDVYWVRGTPVLGWLLVGMACGELARTRAREAKA